MKNKILLATAILTIISFFWTCLPSVPCSDHFKTTGIRSITLSEIKDVETFVNREQDTQIWLNEDDTATYDKLCTDIRFNYEGGGTSCANEKREEIIKINVIANEDYNSNYHKGDTLNDIIYIKRSYGAWKLYNLNDFFNKEQPISNDIFLFLNKAPDGIIKNSFKIEYFGSGNVCHTKTTKQIYIKP